MASVEINGTTIYYQDSGGDGPAILFSHGFLMDHTMFDPQIAEFSRDYRCIAWDERGFGKTPAPGPFTYWDSADDAVALLDHLGVEQAVFAGMSQGGYLSLRAALAHPDRVRALILIDSGAHVDPPETIEGYRAMLDALSSGDADTIDAVLQSVAGLILGEPSLNDEWIPKWKTLVASSDIRLPGGALLDRDDISDRLGEIACPVLVIHGTEDVAIPMSDAEAMANGVADSRGLIKVDGAAHAANLTHAAQVNPEINKFLSSL